MISGSAEFPPGKTQDKIVQLFPSTISSRRKLGLVNWSGGEVAGHLSSFDLPHMCCNWFLTSVTPLPAICTVICRPELRELRGVMEAQQRPMKWNYHLCVCKHCCGMKDIQPAWNHISNEAAEKNDCGLTLGVLDAPMRKSLDPFLLLLMVDLQFDLDFFFLFFLGDTENGILEYSTFICCSEVTLWLYISCAQLQLPALALDVKMSTFFLR